VYKEAIGQVNIMTNFREDGYLRGLVSDLTKLRYYLGRKLLGCTIVAGLDLVAGSGCSRERLEKSLLAGWSNNSVHANGPIYTKMALSEFD
jgi:hypothetical protein